MNKILLTIGILGTIFVGLIFFVLSVMGDRVCDVEIQNTRSEGLIVKTFTFTRYDKQMTVDSILLRPKEKLKIGHCIGCSTIDTTNIDFAAIGILTRDNDFKIFKGRELIDYLTSKDKIDCATYLIK